MRAPLRLLRDFIVQHGEANLRAHMGVQAERMLVGETRAAWSAVQRSRALGARGRAHLLHTPDGNEGGGDGAVGRREWRSAPHTARRRRYLEAVLVGKQVLAQLRRHALHTKPARHSRWERTVRRVALTHHVRQAERGTRGGRARGS